MNKSPCSRQNKGIYFAAHSVAMQGYLTLEISEIFGKNKGFATP